MKKKCGLTLTLAVLTLVLVTGCSRNIPSGGGNAPAEKIEGFPVTITDVTGGEIVIPKPPQRIISITPSNTELLFALGLGNRVVAVTDNDDYPAEVHGKERVGGFTVNAEKIVSLEPDLVVAMQSVNMGQIDELRKLGLPVLVVEAQTVDAIYETVRTIAKAAGVSPRGEEIVASMRSRLEEVRQKVANVPMDKRKRVFVELGAEPLYTVGEGSLQHEIVELAGGINIVEVESP